MENIIRTKCGKRIILPLILMIAALACVFGLSACSGEFFTEQDVIDSGYTAVVMYDYQGGTSSDSQTTKVRLKPNSFAPEPGKGDFKAPVRTGYSFKSFCVAETDENGDPVTDAEGNIVVGREWDFARDRVTENITLCAVWWTNFKAVIHYGENGENTKEIDVPRGLDGSPTSVAQSSANINGYTVVSYYLDPERAKETQVTFPATLGFTDEKSVIDVYTDSLEGAFQVVCSERDLTSFSFLEYTNVYLLADIDMATVYKINKYFSFPSTYSGKFYGNGHTITGYTVSYKPTSRTDSTFGMFKIITGEAVVSGITFADAKMTADLSNTLVSAYSLGLFAGTVRAGATIEKISFVNGTLEYSKASGYDEEKITVDKFVGILNESVTPIGCDYLDINIVAVEQ